MKAWLSRRQGEAGRQTAEVNWAGSGDDPGSWAWDRPRPDDFAPPRAELDLHWAFRAAPRREREGLVEPRPSATYGDDLPDRSSPLDDSRLVTVAGREPAARDPAQPGMFDAAHEFAPALSQRGSGDEPAPRRAATDPPRSPSRVAYAIPISAHPAVGQAHAPTYRAPAATSQPTGPGDESVFGDFFVRPAAEATLARAAVDPREWPPVPTSVLPPEPRPLVAPTAGDPDGRRFAWPPPQPRVAPAGERDAAAEQSLEPEQVATHAAQPLLWPAEPAPRASVVEPPPDDAGTPESPPRRQPRRLGTMSRIQALAYRGSERADGMLLVAFIAAAVALALIVILARLVRPIIN